MALSKAIKFEERADAPCVSTLIEQLDILTSAGEHLP